MAKARIFIDFWNFQLGLLEETDGEYSADWKKLPGWLIEQAEEIVGGYNRMLWIGMKERSAYPPGD